MRAYAWFRGFTGVKRAFLDRLATIQYKDVASGDSVSRAGGLTVGKEVKTKPTVGPQWEVKIKMEKV